MNRRNGILLGLAATIMWAELYHGLLGGADRFETAVEGRTRRILDAYELPVIQARLDEKPLQRRLILLGPADDFQRRALVDVLGRTPGVNEVRWDRRSPVVDHFAARRAR